MRKAILVACLFLGIIFYSSALNVTFAQSSIYESIDIYVQLNEDGSAHVTERWKAELHEGTENYMVKENLGKSKIENFTVTEDGQVFEFVNKWNINDSQDNKKYKNGIVNTKDGLELSWGIGDYGPHEYIIEYTVTDIVKELKDAQTLFWTFTAEGMNIPRSYVRVEIEAPKHLNKEEEDIWAFGYEGDIEFMNGNIVLESDQTLTAENHVTLLVKFDKDSFATNDHWNKKFSKIKKEALRGSDYDGFWATLWKWIKNIFIALGVAIVAIVYFMTIRSGGNNRLGVPSPRKFRRKFKEAYYRDYPLEDYYLNSYYFVYTMGLGSFNTILTSFLLKWIYEDQIIMHESTTGMLNRKTQKITFIDHKIDKETDEGRLFHSLKKLAGEKAEITDRQLASWAERNYQGLSKWERSVMDQSVRTLIDYGYLIDNRKKFFIFSWGTYELSEKGRQMEENIYKYVNYLHDFSLLSEHEAVNVKLWDEMMIWAAYLNLTDVVMRQFKKLYPKYTDETKLKENTVRNTTHMANEAERRRRRKEKAEQRKEQRRRSRGDGGRASRGGGGGSFGGGSGGGIR